METIVAFCAGLATLGAGGFLRTFILQNEIDALKDRIKLLELEREQKTHKPPHP